MGRGTRIDFIGCPIDSITMDDAVRQCLAWCRATRRPHTVITINSAILVMMEADEALRRACVGGCLIVPDGMWVVRASRLLGAPLTERVAGVDLMARLLAASAVAKLRVFFLGATQRIVTTLVSRVREEHPGLVIAGYRNGYFSRMEHARIITQIRESGADILFVGMPTPFKEVWCHDHKHELGVPVILGVGGSFDVLAGEVARAPKWMQAIGMEWFWRLIMEPRRLAKRYLVTNTLFAAMCLKALFRSRRSRRTNAV